MAKGKCIIDECNKMCSERSRFNICADCRGRIGYAIIKGPGWISGRKKQLTKITDRLEYLGYRK